MWIDVIHLMLDIVQPGTGLTGRTFKGNRTDNNQKKTAARLNNCLREKQEKRYI